MGREVNPQSIAQDFLQDSIHMLRQYKNMAEKALEQLPDPERDFFYSPDKESNSIAVIMKHMAGNMRSRWRDFLTSDGEKADRHRDKEFEIYDGETGPPSCACGKKAGHTSSPRLSLYPRWTCTGWCSSAINRTV